MIFKTLGAKFSVDSMKKIIFLIVSFCLCTNVFSQETLYIRDTLYVVLRSDLSEQSEIVFTGLVSGTPVTLLDESEDGINSKVKTEDGTEGWIQTQYLSEDTATKQDLQQAKARLVQMEAEIETLQEQLDSLNASSFSKADTLAAENDAILEQSDKIKVQLQALRTENNELKRTIENDNYLNGAFAVLIGVFIALLVPMLKRSKPSEWT